MNALDVISVLGEPVAVIVIALVLYWRNGRPPRVPLVLESSQAIPEGIPPAVAGMVWRRGRVVEDDAIATLLDLTRRGVVEMSPEPVASAAASGLAAAPANLFFLPAGQTYRMTLRRDRLSGLSKYERSLLGFVFDGDAGGDSLTIEEYRARVHADTAPFFYWFREWQHLVRQSPEAAGLLRPESYPTYLHAAYLGLLQVAVLLLSPLLLNMSQASVSGPIRLLAIATIALSVVVAWWVMLHVPGPTRRGAELLVRYRALHRQLRSTRIGDMPPQGLMMWDQYFVYAVEFGLARKAIAALYIQTPGVLQRLGFQVVSMPRSLRTTTPGESEVTREFEAMGPTGYASMEVETAADDLRIAEEEAARLSQNSASPPALDDDHRVLSHDA
jgi:hypothetical protein